MPSPNSKPCLNRRSLSAGAPDGGGGAAARAALLGSIAFVWGSVGLAGDWNAHQQKIGTMNSKIASYESEIHELIEHKNAMEDANEARAVVDQISHAHKELQKVAKEREDELAHMRFKHPEKGELTERQYMRYRVKTLEELEAEPGLEGKLDRIKRVVEIKYRVEPKEKGPSSDPGSLLRNPASSQAPERPVLRQ